MEQVKQRGEHLCEIRELLEELRVISEMHPQVPSERSGFRKHQIEYMSYLFFNLDRAVADYYEAFIKEKK